MNFFKRLFKGSDPLTENDGDKKKVLKNLVNGFYIREDVPGVIAEIKALGFRQLSSEEKKKFVEDLNNKNLNQEKLYMVIIPESNEDDFLESYSVKTIDPRVRVSWDSFFRNDSEDYIYGEGDVLMQEGDIRIFESIDLNIIVDEF